MRKGKELMLSDFTDRELVRFRTSFERGNEQACWEWKMRLNDNGYGWLWRTKGGHVLAHRMAYALENGYVPAGLVVRHLCHNPHCVNPCHLALGTYHDNRQDDLAAGKYPVGERNASARLTDCGAVLIRQMFKAGVTQTDISKKFGLSLSLICKVVRNRRWLHVS